MASVILLDETGSVIGSVGRRRNLDTYFWRCSCDAEGDRTSIFRDPIRTAAVAVALLEEHSRSDECEE